MDDGSVYLMTGAAVLAASTAGYLFLRRKWRNEEADAGEPGGTPWYLQSEEVKEKEKERKATSPAAAAATSSSVSAGKKKKPNRKPSKREEAALGNRPQLAFGSRVWHRQAEQMCEIVKVYFDDVPPYYQVRFDDGSERATVRARLDTLEERETERAAAERAEAEARAEAVAAELLREEASTKPPRRPTSDNGKKKKSK